MNSRGPYLWVRDSIELFALGACPSEVFSHGVAKPHWRLVRSASSLQRQ